MILLVAGCGQSQTKPREANSGPIDPGIFVEYTKVLRDYIEALLLLDGPNPRDWVEAKRKLEVLNFAYFKEDRALFQAFREGTAEQSEVARKELARRGKMLQYVLVFIEDYRAATWDHARKEMLALGEGAPEFLTISLLKLLLNGHFMKTWPQIRYQLVAVGDVALETAAAFAKQKADEATPTAISREEDLKQLIMVIIGFGDRGRPALEALAKHRVWTVRKTLAKAIGDSLDATGSSILIAYLKIDVDWQVKAAAADALGQLKAARNEVGPVLIECMKTEKDAFVRKVILRSIGRSQYLGSIPFLMTVLDVVDYNVIEMAMEALYSVTGERLTTVAQWKRWYRDTYPTWIKTQKP